VVRPTDVGRESAFVNVNGVATRAVSVSNSSASVGFRRMNSISAVSPGAALAEAVARARASVLPSLRTISRKDLLQRQHPDHATSTLAVASQALAPQWCRAPPRSLRNFTRGHARNNSQACELCQMTMVLSSCCAPVACCCLSSCVVH